jgi:hypothetical protein
MFLWQGWCVVRKAWAPILEQPWCGSFILQPFNSGNHCMSTSSVTGHWIRHGDDGINGVMIGMSNVAMTQKLFQQFELFMTASLVR